MRILENTPAPFLPTQKLVWMFLTTKPPKWSKKLRISGEQAPTRGCIWIPWVRIVLRLNVWTLHVFMEGSLDIFERCPDQHNANLFAGFAALSLSAPVSGKETATQRRNRLQLHESADWIIDTHLRELHPLLWLKGAH